MQSSNAMRSISSNPELKGMQIDVPFYSFLCDEISFPQFAEAHGLLTYALNVGQVREENEVRYEKDQTPETNWRQAFKTTAMLYNVEPDIMVKFWPIVDAALQYLELKSIEGTELRQCKTPVTKYHDGQSFGHGIIDELGRIVN